MVNLAQADSIPRTSSVPPETLDSAIIQTGGYVGLGHASGANPQDDELGRYLYQSGFRQSLFADTWLQINQLSPPFRLHALMLARSAVLNRHLDALARQGRGPPFEVVLDVPGPYVSRFGFEYALASLYQPHPAPLPAAQTDLLQVLAASATLGLDALAQAAATAVLQGLEPARVPELLVFSGPAHAGPYPPFTAQFADTARSMLERTLPDHLPTYRPLLLSVPFPLVKQVLESPLLPCASSQQRYTLARDLLAERREWRRSQDPTQGVEETVVLAFGAGSCGIEVLQRVRNGRKHKTLWKAGGS